MTPEREAFMRKMESNQFFPPDWRKLIECLDGIAKFRKERDKWRNQHHALNVDNMELQVQIEEAEKEWTKEHQMWHKMRERADKAERKLKRLSKNYCACPNTCFVCKVLNE